MIKKIVLGGKYEDPRDWNGKNPKCELCEKQVEKDDDFCEDHQRCYDCGENEDCDCKKTLYCRCGKYKEDNYELCWMCLND